MKFVVTQMGARHDYAVPLVLENAGMLERFYTDLAGNVGLGKWLVKCGRLLGCAQLAGKLAGRRVPEAVRAKTVTFGAPACRRIWNNKVSADEPGELFRAQLRWSRALGSAMVQRGFGRATHLYSMLGECGPVIEAAKKQRLVVVTEVYIMLSAEKILAQEQLRFPNLEPPSPDLDDIRNEFPEQKSLLNQTDLFVCPSRNVREDLTGNFELGRGQSCIVPYGIDSSWLELPSRPMPGRVLFVGTAGLRKGIHYLAMAAEALHRRGRRYEFRVAGDVRPEMANFSSCRHLVFLGRVTRAEVRKEYSQADIFVLPSLAEGSAEATYEALAAGLPVITTRATGSVVRKGMDGWVVSERDSVGLAAAIDRAMEDRALREKVSVMARGRARDYTFERYGERLVAALQDLNS